VHVGKGSVMGLGKYRVDCHSGADQTEGPLPGEPSPG
jgi:hypothetical protein